MAFTLVFTTACDPMEDVYNEIGDTEEGITGDIAFEMSDDDYDALDKGYGNFNSTDEAKELIPGLLTSKYPVWGEGSLANVSFKVYAPKKSNYSLIVYTVSDDDYSELGFNYGNFSSADHMITFLDWKYPNPDDRVLVSLTYDYYSGSTSTVNNGFIYVDGEWNFLQGFTTEEYNDMGQSYANFGSASVAESYIPAYLNDYYTFPSKEAGYVASMMYKLYTTDVDDIDGDGRTDDSATYSYPIYFIFDGTDWTEYEDNVIESVQFGHDGDVWVPDNTINYTLTTADFDSLGTEYGEPGYYDNFDVRSGKAAETEEARLAYVNTVLLANFPDAEEGQKFSVFFAVYTGASEVWNMKVVLTGGEYILQ